MKIYKTDIDENQLLKCDMKDCVARRHKRASECKACRKKVSDINNAKALNTGNKIWSVYRMSLDGFVYYGQTGTQITRRAANHRSSARRGIHKNSYIHQQIVARNMSNAEVASLMEVLCIAGSEEESLEFEEMLIRSAIESAKVCNRRPSEWV